MATYFLPEYQFQGKGEWVGTRITQGGPHVPFANVPALFETEEAAREYVEALDRSANGIFALSECAWRYTPVEVPIPYQWSTL